MNSYKLTEQQIAFYQTEGYLVVERVDATIREVTAAAIASGDQSRVELEPETVAGQRVARRVLHPFEQHETFRAVATDARLLDCIEQLIGSSFARQHSKLNMKPAKIGTVVDWHQEMTCFPHTNPG